MERVKWLFHVYDLDNDGTITIAEFREVLKYHLKKAQLHNVETIFTEIDKDGDGVLLKEEFIREVINNKLLKEYFDVY